LNDKNAVEFSDFTTAYPEKPASENDSDIAAAPFSLGPLHFSIPKGRLTVVVGPVGSGKSTLLLALAGYLPTKLSSTFRGTDSVALSTHEAWIRSGTVRENIVFASHWDEVRYKRIVQACCLESDFASWPARDRTNVGEKGSTVSGGQRARISLARAVYSGAELLLLDDPLAAVDAYVGSPLFHECIRELKQTVVLG
jgi:ABC-type transport system involved in cytochrome bd biosynthesis fused ATPase/permease subunit